MEEKEPHKPELTDGEETQKEAVEEEVGEVKGNEGKNKVLFIALGVVVMIVVIAIIAIATTAGGDDDDAGGQGENETDSPTISPTVSPTSNPTLSPTEENNLPTLSPTQNPSSSPTQSPTLGECPELVTDGLIELRVIGQAQFIIEPRNSEYNFQEAGLQCATHGATLPFYNSFTEFFLVRDFINEVLAIQEEETVNVYVGAQQNSLNTIAPLSIDSNPEFFSKNGEVPWQAFEPRFDADLDDICVTAEFSANNNGEWKLGSCSQRLGLLCRREMPEECL